jgi:glycine/D-amino acid oxidase-like deaminating enzyme
MRSEEKFVVVGGGIAGASIAYHLSRESDTEVVVYERNEELASETTAKSGAFFGHWGRESPTRLRLMQYSVELLNQFLSQPQTDLTYRSVGRLHLATTKEGATEVRKQREVYRQRTEDADVSVAPSSYFDGEDLFRTLPLPRYEQDVVTGALYCPNIGYVNPEALAAEFAARAEGYGAQFERGQRVDRLRRDGNEITGLVVEGEHVTADGIIVAAGPWTPELVRSVDIDLPIRHTLGPVLILDPDENQPHSVQSFKHEETGIYARRNHDSTVLVGNYPGEYEDVTGQYDPDQFTTVPDEIRSTAREVLRKILPTYAQAPCIDEWVGIRSLTPDRDPLIGNVGLDGLSIAVFNASGIQLSAAAGRIIARQFVHGEQESFDEAVSPTRFDAVNLRK